jgi:molecular chaperone GrpE
VSDQVTPEEEADAVEDDPSQEPGAGIEVDATEDVDLDDDPVAKERDTYKNALQHLQADFENYRKRVNKQSAELMERANEGFASKLLPVLDTIDLAQSHDPNSSVEQVATALLDVLGKEGLVRMATVGEPFDPNQHEAVAHDDGEGGESRISEEFRAGYTWKGRVVRPAMVKTTG